uniref:ABC transporter, ATP-binding protein n=1 Tax=uncultured bacterium esnapd2 TaxID=1366601 RepID=S5TTS8_9BACT|nr:ABC transporter, ATP-binding protein [uncultured bacterium esnapd2]
MGVTELMIDARGISKKFGDVTVLDGVSLQAPRGTVLGLLGHNGAGKTTMVNVLTTMLPFDGGKARVAGHDVVREGRQVRARIGLTGQFASVDGQLNGHDNLVLIARLLGAGKRDAMRRAGDLLELFDLTDAARKQVQHYSGGMRRRLDLAASLVGNPEVIFLDEPTTGLDPVSRLGLWETVEKLVADGTTVLLTTQYLEEADRLADTITVLSAGKVVATGSTAELKATVGKRTATVTLSDVNHTAPAMDAMQRAGLSATAGPDGLTVTAPVDRSADLAIVVRALDEALIEPAELAIGEPTLDDVYLSLAATKTGG